LASTIQQVHGWLVAVRWRPGEAISAAPEVAVMDPSFRSDRSRRAGPKAFLGKGAVSFRHVSATAVVALLVYAVAVTLLFPGGNRMPNVRSGAPSHFAESTSWPVRAQATHDVTSREARDRELMLKVKVEASHDAFRELLPSIRPVIRSRLRALLPASEVDDGEANTLQAIWANRHNFDPERCVSVKAWVARIATNKGISLLRKARGRTRRLADDEALADGRPGAAALVEQGDWIAWLRQLCDEVLADAPSYVQTAWALRLQDVPFADIAAIVGRSVGTVAGGLFRFRARLIARIRESGHIPPGGDPLMDMNVSQLKPLLEARAQAGRLLERVKKLIEDANADPESHQVETNWVEVKEIIDDLKKHRAKFEEGFISKIWAPLKEARERLMEDPEDVCGRNNLGRVVSYLTRILQ